MESTFQQAYLPADASRRSAWARFINWSDSQEKNRLGWLALALAGHGCVMTPITMFAIVLGGNNIIYWFLVAAAMGTALVTNLAAMPTKITIPVFFASILVDLIIIGACIAAGFNIAGTYI